MSIDSTGLFAQRVKPEQFQILGISVDGNNTQGGTESGAIIANSGLKVGDVISIPGDETRQATQRLWALRIFSDIQIVIDRKVDNGIFLLIKVKEMPRLDKVEIKGTDDVSEDDVKKKVTLVNGQIITPDDINKVVKNIKALYEEEGHLLAEVKPESKIIDSSKSNRIVLELNIDEGPKLTINQITFSGNKAFTNSDLKGEFEDTKEKRWWHFILANPKFESKKYF